jgi:hypothetical protein
MKKPHAHWLTVHKAVIDQDTSIEILWETAPNTLKLLLFRINHGGSRSRLVTETIGPYRCLAELRHQLCVLFGELSARCICHPCPWLPPSIPVAPASVRPSPSVPPSRIDAQILNRRLRAAAGIASQVKPRPLTTPPTSKSSH